MHQDLSQELYICTKYIFHLLLIFLKAMPVSQTPNIVLCTFLSLNHLHPNNLGINEEHLGPGPLTLRVKWVWPMKDGRGQ